MIKRLAGLLLAFQLLCTPAWAVGFGTPASIGTASGASGTTLTMSISAAVGNLLVCGVFEASSSFASGTLSDTVNSSWTLITSKAANNVNSNGGLNVFYFAPTAALTSITLTYARGGASGVTVAMSCFQVAGQAGSPLDTAVTATGFGSTSSTTVTGGAPSVPNELIVGIVGYNQAGITQDSTNGAYATPPVLITASGNKSVFGGYIIYTGTTARTYAPTISGGATWASIMVGFKPGSSNFIFMPAFIP